LDIHGHVLSTGYNGVAAGLPHCNEVTEPISNPNREHWQRAKEPVYGHACSGANSSSGTDLDACEAIHAEQNALLQCRDVNTINTCYTTVSPCITCVKLLMNTSCQRIVFEKEYPHPQAKVLWLRMGRKWEQMGANEMKDAEVKLVLEAIDHARVVMLESSKLLNRNTHRLVSLNQLTAKVSDNLAIEADALLQITKSYKELR
jgi:dCMP deaminase